MDQPTGAGHVGNAVLVIVVTNEFFAQMDSQLADTQNFRRSGAIFSILIPANLLAFSLISTVVHWFVASSLLRISGGKIREGAASEITHEQMRRLWGWSYAPAIIGLLSLVPGVGILIVAVVSMLTLPTGIMAIRAAFNFSISQAIAVILQAWLYASVIVVVAGFVLIIVVFVVIPQLLRATSIG